MVIGQRKYFLDWLRVAAFGLLIVYHTGILYVTWHYNLKSPRIFEDLEFAMIALNPWRLALLFFVSGVASSFLMDKLGPSMFARDRLKRLLPVILFGMLVIIPPQTYVELLHKGYVTNGYLRFWFTSYLTGESFPGKQLPTWDHLWFLVYLLAYVLALSFCWSWLKVRLINQSSGFTLALIVIPAVLLCGTNILVSEVNPTTHAFVDDWAAHLRWFSMFASGVVCAKNQLFWDTLQRNRWHFGYLTLTFLVLELSCNAYWKTGQMDAFWDGILYSTLSGIYGWCAILTLSGFAAGCFDKPSLVLSYLNVAILPVYVLHQPILLITAFFVFPMDLPVLVEVAMLIGVTAFGSLLIYEALVRRWRVPRILFGLKT